MDQVKYRNKLQGVRALIIGGSSGIGYGVAEALLEHGATVTISSSSSSRVSEATARLQAAYPSATSRITGKVCDLSDPATLESNISQLLASTGTLDHIIHTAGEPIATGPLSSFDLARIQQAGMVRFFAPMLLAKLAPAHLAPGPRSSLTLTSGGVADRPNKGWAIVNAYFTGLQGLTRGLALEMKPVRVNLVSPGAVDTALWEGMGLDENMTGTVVSSNGGLLLA